MFSMQKSSIADPVPESRLSTHIILQEATSVAGCKMNL